MKLLFIVYVDVIYLLVLAWVTVALSNDIDNCLLKHNRSLQILNVPTQLAQSKPYFWLY